MAGPIGCDAAARSLEDGEHVLRYSGRMLRVLTLSTLFPNRTQPTLGPFVERQTLGLAALADVQLEVVAPVGVPFGPLSLHPHYAPRASLPREEDWKGLRVHRPRYPVIPRMGARWTARWMANALLPELRSIQARFPFDVIDAEFFWPDGPAALRLAAALDVPFSVKARGSDIALWGNRPGIRRQLLAAARAAAGLLAVSASLKDEMVALGMPADKIRVHYTGVDLELFAPCNRAEAKAALGIGGPLIVTVGALIARKGQALVIEALAALPEATLVLIGDGPERKALQALAGQLGLGSRVRFAGAVPAQQVARLVAAADVMMLPTQSEGLANVWIEALASGTPVVTSDIPPAREAIPPGTGRLVALETGALAAAARALIEQPPDSQRLRDAVQRFSWETNAQALYHHLSEAAAVSRSA